MRGPEWLGCQRWRHIRQQGEARLRRRMLGEVCRGFTGIVIVRAAMLVMMVARTFQMVDLVGDVKHFRERKSTPLHRKTLQWEQKHQENAEKTTH